jgi:hypothetical protein
LIAVGSIFRSIRGENDQREMGGKMIHVGSLLSKPARRLAVAFILTASAVALLAAPALATNEGNECNECTHMTLNENWVKNVEAYNLSGVGYCDYLWHYNGSGWEKLINYCNSSLHGITLCYPYEVWSHGESTRYYTSYTYSLEARQDNFTNCE